MDMKNPELSVCRNYLKKGELRAAMSRLAGLPSHLELYNQYVSRFQEENYLTYDIDPPLNEILLCYQKYYREVFYLELSAEDAARRLWTRLSDCLRSEPDGSPDALEEQVAESFRRKSFHILTGRTSGYYGPYIWTTEELKRYTVELPDGVQEYTVKLLDGFVMKSWLDYISFGLLGTSGWANGDGLIHCVRASYDLDSEAFRVSLLKHEAQHAADLARYQGMSSEDLEYRAKLVELIYSRERDMFSRFAEEADDSKANNGHALAASRIVAGFERYLGRSCGESGGPPVCEAQSAARRLFAESTAESDAKYL